MGRSIEYAVPYSLDKNLGRAANEICRKSTADYVCLMDGDGMFLDNLWGKKIDMILEANPDGDIFGCVTNRLKNTHQLYENKISDNSDILYHKKISDRVWKECGTVCVDSAEPVAGLFLLFRRKVWEDVKFIDGLWGVDYVFCHSAAKLRYKIKIMTGLYMFHFYRFDKDWRNISHLL